MRRDETKARYNAAAKAAGKSDKEGIEGETECIHICVYVCMCGGGIP